MLVAPVLGRSDLEGCSQRLYTFQVSGVKCQVAAEVLVRRSPLFIPEQIKCNAAHFDQVYGVVRILTFSKLTI